MAFKVRKKPVGCIEDDTVDAVLFLGGAAFDDLFIQEGVMTAVEGALESDIEMILLLSAAG